MAKSFMRKVIVLAALLAIFCAMGAAAQEMELDAAIQQVGGDINRLQPFFVGMKVVLLNVQAPKAASDYVLAELGRVLASGRFQVVARTNTDRALSDRRLSSTGAVSNQQAASIAQALSASYVFMGSLEKTGNTWRFQTKVLNALDGTQKAAATITIRETAAFAQLMGIAPAVAAAPVPAPAPAAAPNQTPVAGDYNIGNLSQTAGAVRAVTITPKTGKSGGAVTVLYNGSPTLPAAAGTYRITFNVAAASGWNAASALSAGNLTIAAAPASAQAPTPTAAPTASSSANMPSSVQRTLAYNISDSVDRASRYKTDFSAFVPSLQTFVNNDGSVTVCSQDWREKTTYIYEYNANLQEQRTFNFKNELDKFGAFTKDTEGNYYFCYAFTTEDKNAENMAVVKYNRNGQKTKTYKLIAYAPNSYYGVNTPFDAGTCRLELSGSMLAVYFAREMFKGSDGINHQASYGFVLDKDTFERIDTGQVTSSGFQITGNNVIPFVSHSFNQFVLPIDNGFIFADHGDANPRSFAFAKFTRGSATKRLNSFTFVGNSGDNETNAQMGDVAKTSTGFIFAGTYGTDRNTARNLFVLTLNDNMTSCSAPIYLTNYTSEEAAQPKIVAIGSGNYLVLWEKYEFSSQTSRSLANTSYRSTYSMVINERGQVVRNAADLGKVRLNMYDTMRYNSRNGKVYWTINDSYTSFTVYALDAR